MEKPNFMFDLKSAFLKVYGTNLATAISFLYKSLASVIVLPKEWSYPLIQTKKKDDQIMPNDKLQDMKNPGFLLS